MVRILPEEIGYGVEDTRMSLSVRIDRATLARGQIPPAVHLVNPLLERQKFFTKLQKSVDREDGLVYTF